jgi:hypothetical protein
MERWLRNVQFGSGSGKIHGPAKSKESLQPIGTHESISQETANYNFKL